MTYNTMPETYYRELRGTPTFIYNAASTLSQALALNPSELQFYNVSPYMASIELECSVQLDACNNYDDDNDNLSQVLAAHFPEAKLVAVETDGETVYAKLTVRG